MLDAYICDIQSLTMLHVCMMLLKCCDGHGDSRSRMMLTIIVETPFAKELAQNGWKIARSCSPNSLFVLLTKEMKILHGFYLMAVILIPEQTDRSFLLVRLRERTIAAERWYFEQDNLPKSSPKQWIHLFLIDVFEWISAFIIVAVWNNLIHCCCWSCGNTFCEKK